MLTPGEKQRVTSKECASCGKHVPNRPVVVPAKAQTIAGWRLCKRCHGAVEDFEWDYTKALTMWLRMRGHLKAIKEAQEGWRANKPPNSDWHSRVPDSPPWPHIECEPKEILWRFAMEFLKTVKEYMV